MSMDEYIFYILNKFNLLVKTQTKKSIIVKL